MLVSRRSTFFLTGGPCDCMYSARFGHFPSSCRICALVCFRWFLFPFPLQIDDLSCNDPLTTRTYALFCYLLVTLTTLLLPRKWDQARMKELKGTISFGRRLLFGPSPLGVSQTRGSSGFINCAGRRKVSEPVRSPQSRPPATTR